MEEMSRITHPESSEEIRLHLTISDENQNKLKEAETMDFDTVKHDLGNGNTQALISHSCSVDHGLYSTSHSFYTHSNIFPCSHFCINSHLSIVVSFGGNYYS